MKTQQNNPLIALEGLLLTTISLILASITVTAFLPIVSSQRTIHRYLLANLGLVACFAIALTLPVVIFEKQRKRPVLSGMDFSREKFSVRAGLGALAGLPIAGGWALSFIIQHQSLPTLVNTASIAGFKVELTVSFIATYTLYQLVNQGIVSVSEEMLWRGFLQTKLQKGIGKMKGYLFASLLFALAHLTSIGYSATQVLMEALPGGLIVGYLYIKTKTLTASIFAHWAGNIIERLILLFLNF